MPAGPADHSCRPIWNGTGSLEQCYDDVDGLSLHRYLGNTTEETGGDSAKYLAMNLTIDRQIGETLAVCDLVRGHKRSPKKLWRSFDEWNVWYRERRGDAVNGHGKQAPHLLEEVYNLEDALLVGGMLNTLMRNADWVKIACLAQNVIAPIMTNATGPFRQTIYYPYSWALQYGVGRVLNPLVESTTYDVPGLDSVPHIDAVATQEQGKTSLFLLNRDLSKAHEIEIVWEDQPRSRFVGAQVLTGSDLRAVNGFDAPERVKAQAFEKPSTLNGRPRFEVPAHSYTIIQWGA